MTLKCALYAHPEDSLNVVWLVDYQQQHERQRQDVVANGRRLPAEERFVVLFDSRVHRAPTNSSVGNNHSNELDAAATSEETSDDNSANAPQLVNEVALYGARVLVRETRLSLAWPQSVYKETQVLIRAAHINDSAR